tara:strand:- start:79 stop:1191 length:1113 start_codon:yes stop_codon:yes gene_type:complete
MKFSTSKKQLQSSLLKLSKVIPSRSTLPILSNVLLSVRENDTILRATDLEISLRVKLPTSVERIGEITIPVHSVLGVINEYDEETRLTFEVLENKIIISSDKGSFEIMGRPAVEFPSEPEKPNNNPININTSIFNDIINKTIFAVSKDELKPALSGVLFQIKNNSILSVSTDGHRLVKYIRNGLNINFNRDVIIPKKFLSLISSNLSKTENINLYINENQVMVEIGSDVFYSRVIDERFPDFESVIPKDNNKELIINRLEFLSTVKRVSVLSNKTTKQITLNLTNDNIKITTKDNEKSSKGFENISGSFTGEDLIVGYNAVYLKDILSHLTTDEITIKLNSAISAGLFYPKEQLKNTDLTMLLMPIRLNN